MKIPSSLLTLSGAAFIMVPVSSSGAEPVDPASIPSPGDEWSVIDSGSTTGSMGQPAAWVNYRNPGTGDILSIVAGRSNGLTMTNSPVRQASIETFTSNGLARMSVKGRTGVPIADTIRNRFVTISTGTSDTREQLKALEFTYVYGKYISIVGGMIYFVQHTSQNPITSEQAFDGICSLIGHELSGETPGVSRGFMLHQEE